MQHLCKEVGEVSGTIEEKEHANYLLGFMSKLYLARKLQPGDFIHNLGIMAGRSRYVNHDKKKFYKIKEKPYQYNLILNILLNLVGSSTFDIRVKAAMTISIIAPNAPEQMLRIISYLKAAEEAEKEWETFYAPSIINDGGLKYKVVSQTESDKRVKKQWEYVARFQYHINSLEEHIKMTLATGEEFEERASWEEYISSTN